jgi:hypothetical protein
MPQGRASVYWLSIQQAAPVIYGTQLCARFSLFTITIAEKFQPVADKHVRVLVKGALRCVVFAGRDEILEY